MVLVLSTRLLVSQLSLYWEQTITGILIIFVLRAHDYWYLNGFCAEHTITGISIILVQKATITGIYMNICLNEHTIIGIYMILEPRAHDYLCQNEQMVTVNN